MVGDKLQLNNSNDSNTLEQLVNTEQNDADVTALIAAVERMDHDAIVRDIMESLFKQGANIEQNDNTSATALMYAAALAPMDHDDIMGYLLGGYNLPIPANNDTIGG